MCRRARRHRVARARERQRRNAHFIGVSDTSRGELRAGGERLLGWRVGAGKALEAMRACHADEKSQAWAKEVLASLEIAFIYRTRDAIRTCLWPIVVMQRRNASFLAEPVVVDRVPRGRSIWLLSDAGPQRPGPKPRTG